MNIDRNYEAEIAVIGSILKEPKCLSKIAHKLSADDFTTELCSIIYEAAVDAAERGKDYDVICAVDTAKTRLSEAEAARFVLDCVDITQTTVNVEQHAAIIHNHAGKRHLKESLQIITDESRTPQEIATGMITECQAFLQDDRTDRLKTLADAIKEMYDGKTRKAFRIDTGFPRLDYLLKGMWSGNLVLIGARPGVGKSAVGIDLAITAAKAGHKVLFFSLEMNADEIAERLIARHSTVDMDALIDNAVDDAQWGEIGKVGGWLSKLPLTISDEPHLTVAKVRARARTIPELKLIVIDYISLMSAERNFNNRNQELGSISRGLKLLANELQIPVIALAQLNRNTDETERPSLRDLRDSGELEQDANKVIFLWKVEEMPEGLPQKIGFYVAKNRRGRTGTTINMFHGAHMKFIETEERYQPKTKKRKGALFGD